MVRIKEVHEQPLKDNTNPTIDLSSYVEDSLKNVNSDNDLESYSSRSGQQDMRGKPPKLEITTSKPKEKGKPSKDNAGLVAQKA